jgi:hypothetical protein
MSRTLTRIALGSKVYPDYQKMFQLMQSSLDKFCSDVPKPEYVKLSFGNVFRYCEKTINQALVQKLARMLSMLHVTELLVINGYIQEQGIMQRAIDETEEDITFLAYSLIKNDTTELHERFLSAFWEEEIDETGDILKSAQKRPMIPRKKIRAFIAKYEKESELNDSRGIEIYKTISNFYSGFVHGASPHIMGLYNEKTKSFYTDGVKCTMDESADDFWNYMYRGLLSFLIVAYAFRDQSQIMYLNEWKTNFEKSERKSQN